MLSVTLMNDSIEWTQLSFPPINLLSFPRRSVVGIKETEMLEWKDPFESVNSIQHGGDHYKNRAIQPWDYVIANQMGYLEGTIVKYITRYKDKGGVEDLKKA